MPDPSDLATLDSVPVSVNGTNGHSKPNMPELVPTGRHGGKLWSGGVPGNKGGLGGDHNKIRAHLSQLVGDRKVRAYLKRLLTKPSDPDTFLKAFHEAFDRAHGKAVQPVSGPDGGPIPVEHVFVHLPPKDPEP